MCTEFPACAETKTLVVSVQFLGNLNTFCWQKRSFSCCSVNCSWNPETPEISTTKRLFFFQWIKYINGSNRVKNAMKIYRKSGWVNLPARQKKHQIFLLKYNESSRSCNSQGFQLKIRLFDYSVLRDSVLRFRGFKVGVKNLLEAKLVFIPIRNKVSQPWGKEKHNILNHFKVTGHSKHCTEG